MGTGAADGGVKSRLFRWIIAARYVLALAMTALILVMIAHTIKVVHRQRELVVSAAGGAVRLERPPIKFNTTLGRRGKRPLNFYLTIWATNHDRRVQVYFTDILGYMDGKISTTKKAQNFLKFTIPDMAVTPQTTTVSFTAVLAGNGTGESLSSPSLQPFFNFFANGSTMRNVVLRLNGTLKTEVYSGHFTRGRTVNYCCAPLTVGGDNQRNTAPVTCTEQMDNISPNRTETSMLNCQLVVD